MAYLARRQAQLARIEARGLQFQLYRFDGADPHPVVLLHGWGDSGATWQFVVDHLDSRRTALAFDARGFGGSQWAADGYWFADYLADLDALLDRLAPGLAVDLVGHSMGGNVAMLYAGVRPRRVRRLISLEGFGLASASPEMAPVRYSQWLDQLQQGIDFVTYDSFEHFIEVLARRNPRTARDRLEFIAHAWAVERADGRVQLRADGRHKRVNPVLYQRDQAEACWRQMTAPLLMVAGQLSEFAQWPGPGVDSPAAPDWLRAARWATLDGTGHMLHHEQPRAVAELIEEFLG